MPPKNEFLSYLPDRPLARGSARAAAPAPSPAAVPTPLSPRVLQTLQLLHAPGPAAKPVSPLLALALFGLFLLVARQSDRWASVVVIVLALGVHELGHFLAMRAFGYTDARIFFVPFFGAVTTGRNDEATARQRGVVLLAGAGPGIVLGFTLVALSTNHAVRALGYLLVTVNASNLAPIEVLDGGRLISLLLSSRWPFLAKAFGGVLAIAAGAVAFVIGSKLLGFVALVSFVASSGKAPVAKAAATLRGRWPSPPKTVAECTDDYLEAAVCALQEQGRPFDRMKPAALADVVRRVHVEVRSPLPSAGDAVILLTIYSVLVGMGVFAVVR